MGNTRIMRLDEYDEKLQEEAEELRRTVPQMKAELCRDPEGCFGGRGNNFGQGIVEDAEGRLNRLTNQGYSIRTKPYIEMLKAGANLIVIEKVIARDDKLFIGGAEGYRRTKEIEGQPVEVNWVYGHEMDTWKGQEPPQVVIETAEAVANHYGSTLMEWRGDFYAPRVYLW